MKQVRDCLSKYNAAVKETNGIYHAIARYLGLSDSVFWILYTIREANESITQRDIVNANSFPPQTINSALKKMENDGLVKLLDVEDKRKKQVILTETGAELAQKTVDMVSEIETEAMGLLSEEERKTFIELLWKYTDFLKEHLTPVNLQTKSLAENKEKTGNE